MSFALADRVMAQANHAGLIIIIAGTGSTALICFTSGSMVSEGCTGSVTARRTLGDERRHLVLE